MRIEAQMQKVTPGNRFQPGTDVEPTQARAAAPPSELERARVRRLRARFRPAGPESRIRDFSP
jgi:hypothetical protein